MQLRKRTQNLPTSSTSCRLNTHNQLGRLCIYGKDNESSHKRKHTNSDSCGYWRQEHSGVRPEQGLSCPPQAGSGMSTVLEGTLGRQGGLRHPVRERMLTVDSRKTFIILTCSVAVSQFFSFLFFSLSHFFPSVVVVVSFVSTLKSI